jgi:hypothetical protein
MGVFALAFLLLLAGAGIGFTVMWYKLATTVADTVIEDRSAREFLKSLKVGRARLGESR